MPLIAHDDPYIAILEGQIGATVRDFMGRLDVTGTAVRHHLARLIRDGIVCRVPDRSHKPGRPRYFYSLTDARRDEAMNQAAPPHDSSTPAGAM